MSSEHRESHISWGKVLAGAAVTAGAVAIFVVEPEIGKAILGAAKDISTAIYSMIGNLGGWLADTASATLDYAAKYPTLTIASASAAGAVVAAGATKKEDSAPHAAREDMRQSQARMIALMQAQGYQPVLVSVRK